MIEFVETPGGLMPKPLADRMAASQADQRARYKAAHDAALLQFRDEVARTLGVSASTLPVPTVDQIDRAAAQAKARFTTFQLAQAYPCRECRTTTDEAYKALCAARGQIPCFVAESFRGCAQFKSRPVVSF